ncbi:MAG: methyl-accepting chemotaxis protein [Lachnospiraceae bacterium]|nr:methyl-accepting chemotaxis protein [Lachnospiraceae bacterium]
MKENKNAKILNQFLRPILLVMGILALTILCVLGITSYRAFQNQIRKDSQAENELIAKNVSSFMSEAYALSEELANSPDILTMETDVQTPILEDCVSRNDYLELLYIQDTTGMQTGRSSGELADRSTRWWFQQVMADKQPFVSKSYYSVNTGMPCASVFFPMYDDGSFIGVFATDIKLDYLVSMVNEYSDVDNDKIVFIIDGEGNIVAHPDATYIEELYNYVTYTKTVSVKDSNGNAKTDEDGNILTQEENIYETESFKNMISDVMSGKSGNKIIKMEDGKYYASYSPVALDGYSDQWSVVTLQRRSKLMMPIYVVVMIALIITALALVAAAFIVNGIAKKVTNPIVDITGIIGAASEGDFSIKADTDNNTEVGVLAESFNVLTDKVSRVLNETVSLLHDVHGSASRLSDISKESENVVSDMESISEGAVAQSDDTRKVVELTEQLKDCHEQLHEMSKVLVRGVQATKELSDTGIRNVNELKSKSEASLVAVQSSYDKVMELNKSSEQIGKIVQEINDISSETSLLSLNASIEAARAGEQGRGFAVVAEQISSLADNSAVATENIEGIVSDIQKQISDIVVEIDYIKDLFQDEILSMSNVEESFAHFHKSSQESWKAVEQVETLIDTADNVNEEVVSSVDNIYEISKKTEKDARQAAIHIMEQTEAIYEIAEKVEHMDAASEMIENEMSKFTLE